MDTHNGHTPETHTMDTHTMDTHTMDTHYRHTLWTPTRDTQYGHTLWTHTIDTHQRHTVWAHTVDTHHRHTPETQCGHTLWVTMALDPIPGVNFTTLLFIHPLRIICALFCQWQFSNRPRNAILFPLSTVPADDINSAQYWTITEGKHCANGTVVAFCVWWHSRILSSYK